MRILIGFLSVLDEDHEGDVSVLKKLAASVVEFDPRFEIIPAQRVGRPS